MKKILVLAALFCASAFAEVKPGSMAPEFNLKGHDGKSYKLSEMKGDFVVLEWFNNDCPYVDKHYHEDHRNMQKLQEAWIKKGTTIHALFQPSLDRFRGRSRLRLRVTQLWPG